jgi:protein SCO1/2
MLNLKWVDVQRWVRRICALGLLGLAACNMEATPSFHATDVTGAEYGKDFQLLDKDGQTRSLADYRGKVVMVFFGFLHCPDVCPTALSRAVEVRERLGALGDQVQVIFISVDPERDTPQMVNAYVNAFDPSFIGLHATPETLPEVAKAFRVFYRKVPLGEGEGYTMDHTATSYVYDRDGRLRLAVPHTLDAEQLAKDLQRLIQPAG